MDFPKVKKTIGSINFDRCFSAVAVILAVSFVIAHLSGYESGRSFMGFCLIMGGIYVFFVGLKVTVVTIYKHIVRSKK